MPPVRSRCSRSPARFAGRRSVDQGAGGGAGSGAQLVGRRVAGAGLAALWRHQHLDRRRRRGGSRGSGAATRRWRSCGRWPNAASASPASAPGAYILAEAGLLDGRRATTHWQRTRHFLTTYPKVKLEPDRIFVRDGNIWSSAGISAGIDLALALVGGGFRRRDRAARPRASSCSIIAAAAASRNSPRCWN